MPQDYLSYLDRMAAEYGVPREEARAIYELETNSGRNVRGSSAGAQGHMQLMPATARELGVQNIADPYQNIRGGVKYYAQQRKAFRDPALAAAAYNAGPGRVRRVGGVPRIPETQSYVQRFRGMLGVRPPVTDQAPSGILPQAPQEQQPMSKTDMTAGALPGNAAPSSAEQLRALNREYVATAEQQASDNARRFAEAQARIGKTYGGPSTSDTLFALGRSLLAPKPYKGFAGTMYNVSDALGDLSTASQSSAQKRAEALAELQSSYETGADKSKLSGLEGRRKLLEMQMEQEQATAKAAEPKYDINPITGGYMPRPGTGAQPRMDSQGRYIISNPSEINMLPPGTPIVVTSDPSGTTRYVPKR